MLITSIAIEISTARNEVATIIHHEPQTSPVDERRCELGMVTIKARRFPVASMLPEQTARRLAEKARTLLPSVPVTVFHV